MGRKKAVFLFLPHHAQLLSKCVCLFQKRETPQGRISSPLFPCPPLSFCQLKGPDKLSNLCI